MTEMNELKNLMQQRLIEALTPTKLEITIEDIQPTDDDSAQSSFNIDIISDVFHDKSNIERHKMIYVALGDIMGTHIQKVSINAVAPSENLENNDTAAS